MTVFFDGPYKDYLTLGQEGPPPFYTNLLYLPWIFKPLYGFLSDWCFPFYFRVKGYSLISTFFNIILAFAGMAKVQSEYQSNQTLPSAWIFAILFCIYLNLAFIDAVCQGMTSITYRLENRLYEMKYGRKKESFVFHYLIYMITRTIARPFFYLSSALLRNYYKDRFKELKIGFTGFAIVSLIFFIYSYCFFEELKQKTTINKNTNLVNHLKKFGDCLRKDGTYKLVIFGLLIAINPSLSLDFSQMGTYVSAASPLALYISNMWPGIVMAIILGIMFKRTKSGLGDPDKYLYTSSLIVIAFIFLSWAIWMLWQEVWSNLLLASLSTMTNGLYLAVVIIMEVAVCLSNSEEGYESFTINGVVGLNNLGVNVSMYLSQGLQEYLDLRYYSLKSFTYVMGLSFELAVLPFALATYYLPRRIREKRDN